MVGDFVILLKNFFREAFESFTNILMKTGCEYNMKNFLNYAAKTVFIFSVVTLTANFSLAQTQTTGAVTMSATVSKFVELNSGGPVTLSGNSGGGVNTDGTVNT